MSYTFSIREGANVVPASRDTTGVSALKLVLDKGGSSSPVEVTSGLSASGKSITITVPAGQLANYQAAEYKITGSISGTVYILQDGRINSATASSDAAGADKVTVVNPVSLAGPITVAESATGQLVKTVQDRIRDDFAGSALNSDLWEVVQTGAGQAVSVSSSTLFVTTGTTTNALTVIRSKKSWAGAYRVMFLGTTSLLSQRIGNQEFELRVTNAAGTSYAGWVFNGTTATTQAIRSANNGNQLADVSVTSAQSTAASPIFEIENFIDEVYFHSRASDSVNGRVTSNVRNRQTPDPTEPMFIEIRVRNLSSAPASSTTLSLDAVLVQDISELTAEITGGRGGGGASQAIPVSAPANLGVVLNNTPNISPAAAAAETSPVTSTNLTSSGAYTQANQDWGTGVATRPTRARVTVMHLAGVIHGTLALEESTDGTTWRRTWQSPIPSDGLYHTFDVPMHLRYYRWVFVNGATAQTGFYLAATYMRTDGATDIDKNLSFPLTTAAGQALSASTNFTGPPLDLGGNHMWERFRVIASSDAAGTIIVNQSIDGTNWFTLGSGPSNSTLPAGANAGVIVEVPIVARYIRLVVVNGATAATLFRAVAALVSL